MAAAMALTAGVAWAAPEDVKPADAPPLYKTLKEDVTIPFAGRTVRDYSVGEDGSLILRAGGKYYRAVLWRPCATDLKWEHKIALVSRPTDTLDRFSRVIVDGNACAIESIDEIEKPLTKKQRDALNPEAPKS
jgi:hypothetical protein